MVEPAPVILKISRSMLGDFLRCRKKFYFRHLQEIDEMGPGTVPMRLGTLGHWGLAAGYTAIQELQKNHITLGQEGVRDLFVNSAVDAMAQMVKDGVYYYRGTEKPLALDPENHAEFIVSIGDAINYYADKYAYADYMRYKIVSVEKEYTWQLVLDLGHIDGPFIIELSGVMDFCAEDQDHKKKILTVADHKFVGDVNGALAFLPLDLQMLIYEFVVYHQATEVMGYDDVELLYNLVRREVPPGYGHRSDKTKSGAKSTASQRPEDYLRREVLFHSPTQRQQIESNFLRPALEEMMRVRENDGPFLLTTIKTGGEACGQCEYFARCKAQLVGQGQPKFTHKEES